MSDTKPGQQPPSLAARLKDVHVGLRDDLETTRHVFRGQPAYVVRDPLTFQSHRFDPADYEVLVSIDVSRTLSQIFADLVERKLATRDNEEAFYQFVFSLHRLGFLNLPVSDDKILYRRYQQRQRAQRKQKIVGFMFLQIPLWNPDRFLDKTIRWTRFMFSPVFFVLWLLLVGGALAIVATRSHELSQPLNGLLAARNLPLMWVTLVVLKIFHEFGHAYACKHFGGHVPEMGAYLIAGTPCAYVDATASWGFTRRRDRIIVGLGGMYFEAIFAALAVYVWSATGPSLLNALAYNVMFLASAVTILFNVNPLMRYDGYYILSDLVEIPNLRARATRYVLDTLKRLLLGVRVERAAMSLSMKTTLLCFGVCGSIYKSLVVLGIAAMIATKLFLIGMAFAVYYVGNTLIGLGRNLLRYLWFADETAPMRPRAIALSVVLLVGVPVGLLLVPIPSSVSASGELGAENETTVHAKVPGFVQSALSTSQRHVSAGDILVELSNDALREAVLAVTARRDTAEVRRDAYRVRNPDRAWQEEQRVEAFESELERRQQELADLSVHAPASGRLVRCFRDKDSVGRYVEAGETLALIASGKWQVRAMIDEEQYSSCEPRVGDVVEFRPAGQPGKPYTGTISRVTPAGSRKIELSALTHVGGGDIVVDPATNQAAQPYFEITVVLDDAPDSELRHGMTGKIRLPAQARTLALDVYRRLTRFTNALGQS